MKVAEELIDVIQDTPATKTYNCFMNRISGDRSTVFYELLKRGLLDKGFVSFNCFRPGNNFDPNDRADHTRENYNWQYEQAEMVNYAQEHEQGYDLIPYNNIDDLPLEQCIINSKVSLVIETYISDSHIVFSEKIFRALQLPRPWLMHCSPYSVEALRKYGFDVLDDYVSHDYDQILAHTHRLLNILDQLETFVNRQYSDTDYARFQQAAEHNQKLLLLNRPLQSQL